ncbi:MAG: hypothetical protein IKO14_05235 [Oscillibacter sp.]|nr:hypothetical protein [Oscillibacter sp.]
MSDEATEEKKGKKKKEKKPKKEKPPKPKKEKKPKKGKETPEGAEGGEGGKKKGLPLLLILIPVFVVVIAAALVVIFVVLPKLRKPPAEEEIDPDAPLSAQVENTERAKKGDKPDKDGGGTEKADDGGDTDAEVPPPNDEADAEAAPEVPPPEEEKKPADVDIVVSMTTSESISYFRSLPPEALGLPGESMADYDIFASEHLILVDGVPCKEFHVYSVAGKAGTNSVEGLYLLTQRGARKIYKLDEATNTVTELNWKPPRPEPEPEPLPESGDGAEAEAEPA